MSTNPPHNPTNLLEWLRTRLTTGLNRLVPTGLYGRSLMIIIVPMVILQIFLTFLFMERHWERVTQQLSTAVARDISAIVDIIETDTRTGNQGDTRTDNYELARRIASDHLGLRVSILDDSTLPPPIPRPFFSVLDASLSQELSHRIDLPFWVDTVGDSDWLEIRILLEDKVIRIFVNRKQASASNTHIFLVWMVGASIVLLTIAILFLRNQIRPIQQLAHAAERFGKGLSLPSDFRVRGAAEVRRATLSFLLMRSRVERAVEQRKSMLAGVSHDLRTILTRFKLQLALVPSTPETADLQNDVNDMQKMLEAYIDFARSDSDEDAVETDIWEMLSRFADTAKTDGHDLSIQKFEGDGLVLVRPVAFFRLLSNIISNAVRYAGRVEVSGVRRPKWLTIEVHDDGPGIPSELRAEAMKPFVRLDESRNLDSPRPSLSSSPGSSPSPSSSVSSGSGLGLSIARDIIHSHGGEISLHDSPLGGLCVRLRIPA